MSSTDRAVRAVIGVALLALLFFDASWRWWGLLGLIPLATSLIGWCPLYAPFKFSTRKDN